jgi:hypothetical protein
MEQHKQYKLEHVTLQSIVSAEQQVVTVGFLDNLGQVGPEQDHTTHTVTYCKF